MNEELLSASVLFVQSSTLLVGHNGFIKFFATSNMPTQVCSAPADHQVIQQHWRHLKGNCDLNSAFEKADRLLGQKRTDSH
jgi:hypothetical protein